MKVVVYPADSYGCGHHRLIWPAEELRRAGHDVEVITPQHRSLQLTIDDRTGEPVDVALTSDVDVVVFQRVTHRYLARAVAILRAKGHAVVVDVDDDLSAVHPSNPAWRELHPNRDQYVKSARAHEHSWHYLAEACREATLVTCTTQALLRRYAGHGRGRVLPNYLAEHYYDVEHTDSTVLGWPASPTSHPNDPDVVGFAVARLVQEGHRFAVPTPKSGVAELFGLPPEADDVVERVADVALTAWPRYLASLGVGIAPLADTRFNAAKSWLKPLELSAVGVPWVGSPRADYQRLHLLGCGVLVDRPKDWYRVLRGLLRDERRRAELGEAGRAVAANLRLRDHAWRWWEAWTDAAKLRTRPINYDVVAG